MKICPECLERVDDEHEHCPDDGTELREIHARDDDPMEGRILDEKWVLESRIGGGGMGTVYRAHQLNIDRTVAVKVLRSALVEDDEHVQRFFREANVASNINDPRCVTIYDFGQTADDHILYLAMEYLEGQSLQGQIRERTLTFEETLQVGVQVCEALSVLHENGVVHRDLKPENVFLVDEIGEDLFLKLLDFGLAKVAHSDETPVTATGKIFGTPTFMSPEQCMGSEVGFASDLYALGCMLYELTAGRTPFQGNSSVQILLGHVNRRPPPLSGRVAVPTEFEALIDELLSKDPSDRPGSAHAVKDRLAEILTEITASTAARTPDPPANSEDKPSPVAETLPPEEVAMGPGGREGATDGGFDRTQAGVGPVEGRPEEPGETGDDETEASSEGPEDADEVAEPAIPEQRSERGGTLRFVVAAVVFVAGLAVMWTIMGPTGPSVEEGAPGGPRAVAAGDLAAHTAPAVSRHLRDGAYWTRTAVSWVPRSLSFGVAGLSSLEQTEGDERGTEESPSPEAANTEASADDTSGDPVLPVLTQSAATQVFRSKSGAIKTCFEKAAGTPEFDGGKIRLRLVVGGGGKVGDASIASATVGKAVVRECVLDRAKTWTFPAPPKGGKAVLLHEYEFAWKKLENGKKQTDNAE